jgi:hypothetical protein
MTARDKEPTMPDDQGIRWICGLVPRRWIRHPSRKTTGDPSCEDCGHIHTPDGCTGPPTPSDQWAGVSPSSCDCAFDQLSRPGLTEGGEG